MSRALIFHTFRFSKVCRHSGSSDSYVSTVTESVQCVAYFEASGLEVVVGCFGGFPNDTYPFRMSISTAPPRPLKEFNH